MHTFTPDEQARIDADYAFYKAKFAERQAESDRFADDFGLPRHDLAWEAAMERAQRRAMPDSQTMIAHFREALATRRYAEAVGVAP